MIPVTPWAPLPVTSQLYLTRNAWAVCTMNWSLCPKLTWKFVTDPYHKSTQAASHAIFQRAIQFFECPYYYKSYLCHYGPQAKAAIFWNVTWKALLGSLTKWCASIQISYLNGKSSYVCLSPMFARCSCLSKLCQLIHRSHLVRNFRPGTRVRVQSTCALCYWPPLTFSASKFLSQCWCPIQLVHLFSLNKLCVNWYVLLMKVSNQIRSV